MSRADLDAQLPSCPFCGGDAQDDFIEGESYMIECGTCGTRTGVADSAELAIAAWGRRPVSADQDAQRALLVDEHSAAWQAVCEALDVASPGWLDRPLSGLECAVAAIKEISKKRSLLTDLLIVQVANKELSTSGYLYSGDIDQIFSFARSISALASQAPAVVTDEMCIAAREKFGIGANYARHVYEHMAAQAPAVQPIGKVVDLNDGTSAHERLTILIPTSTHLPPSGTLIYGGATPSPQGDAENTLLRAAQAVVERWDSPLWKDQPHTADFIAKLRDAIDAARKAT